MAQVYVLQAGSLLRNDAGEVLDAHSTVTLICTHGEKILVDSGANVDEDKVVAELARLGLTAEDISLVINTHAHGDHIGCNRLFKKARFMAHVGETRLPDSYPAGAEYEWINSPQRVTSHLLLFPTPGHTRTCLSVVVEKANAEFGAVNETIVVAGDALPLQGNYIKMVPPAQADDVQAARDSLQRIIELAEWVIPGHDLPFRVMSANDPQRL